MQPPKYLLVKNGQLYVYKNRLAHQLTSKKIITAQVPGNNLIPNDVDINYINNHKNILRDENDLLENGFIAEYEHDSSVSTMGIVGYEGTSQSNPSEIDLIELYIYHMVNMKDKLNTVKQLKVSEDTVLKREYMVYLPIHQLIPTRQNFIDFKCMEIYKHELSNIYDLAKRTTSITGHIFLQFCHQTNYDSETDIY